MNSFSSASLIYGPQMHYLDHLGPLCAFMDIPLYVTEEEIGLAAAKFYPGLQVIQRSALEAPHYITQNHKCVFSCLPKPMFDQIFFIPENLYRNKLAPIWVPHGSAMKGESSYFTEALKDDKLALVYGDKMVDTMKEKKAFDNFYACIPVGNYRYEYCEKHASFYDNIIRALLAGKKKHILYAPTWNDYDNSSTFSQAIDILIEKLPEMYKLLVKPHPNMLITENFQILKCMEKYPNVQFLIDFPIIYPLLKHIDIYIGDMSSIASDFLNFDKPMFFLSSQDQHSSLFSCGVKIEPHQFGDIYDIIEKALPHDFELFSDKRREMYKYTFGKKKPLPEIKEQIISICTLYIEEELHLL